MKTQKKRKWTIFFLINSSEAPIRDTIKMINEIRSLELNSRVSVVICLRFSKEHLKPLLDGNDLFQAKKMKYNKLTTMFMELVRANNPVRFQNDLKIVLERPAFDITDPVHVKQYFRDAVLRKHKAKHYLLFSWDHGSGYGIFHESTGSKKSRFLDVTSDKQARILTMEELNSAIRWAFGKKKVNVMIMMNCFMQFIGAGYALRKTVDYMVAPESIMEFSGYNYTYIFQALINEPDLSPRELAKLSVKSFPYKAYSHSQSMSSIEKTSIFANNLQHYSTLARQIDKLVDSLLTLLGTKATKKEFMKLVFDSKMEPGKNLYDFYDFLENLVKSSSFKPAAAEAKLILSVKDLVVIESCIGKDPGVVTKGLSVFFPKAKPTPGIPREGFDDFFEMEFMQRTKWRTLIDKCLD
jgi:hypothetical protein